ncbi:MAG: hypothetical protein KBONHNOK_00358 [Candidatus Methanoperedenaceae archaeon GB50]|nr:MAG: hypothetical protein KBONHNOK_00358 [Candidatus Methanoperedenaceae archaeon GB50]
MKSLQNKFQFLTGLKEIIEQKNIFVLCFIEENTDSTRLLSPKGLMLKFQIQAFQCIYKPRGFVNDESWLVLAELLALL